MTDENTTVESCIGPSVQKLEEIAKQAEKFETSIKIEFDPSKPVPINSPRVTTLMIAVAPTRRHKRPTTLLELTTYEGCWYRGFLSEGMIDMAEICKAGQPFSERGQILYDSLTVKTKGASLGGKELKRLVLEAWCEAFGVSAPASKELKDKDDAKKIAATDLQSELLKELRSGPDGVKRWMKRPDQNKVSYKKSNLEGADLSELALYSSDFQSTNFNKARLSTATILNTDLRKSSFVDAQMVGVQMSNTQIAGCDFSGANLADARFSVGTFNDCNFTGAALTAASLNGNGFARCTFDNADLTGARFYSSNLRGADFSKATLSGAYFSHSFFDGDTKWPPDFEVPIDGLEWKGGGADPRLLEQLQARAGSGPVDFDTFVQYLTANFDRERLKKSLRMLKSEKFQLFSEVTDAAVVGVVKSQTDAELVYSCGLNNSGGFSCCTQNLNSCGGLRGALCKHLLVLLIGLVKAKELSVGETAQWIMQSRAQKPELNKDAASAIFLRYKGAEAGEIDWRPTETMPEDYYAF